MRNREVPATHYLTPSEETNIHVNIVNWLPNRISLADKIGIAAMVIDEINGIIDRMSDEKAEANED